MFSLRFRSTDILLTDVVTPESRVLFHRRIVDRVNEIAPFLSYDDDPYLVIADGKLYWMLRRVHDDGTVSVLDAQPAGDSTTSATR